MKMYVGILGVLLGLLLPGYEAGIDNSVCTPGSMKPSTSSPPKEFPTVSDTFTAHIDMIVPANKTTRSIFEFFDAPNDRAMIVETIAGGKHNNISVTGRDIYNFYGNQVLELVEIFGRTSCGVSQLDEHPADTFIFGNRASSSTGFSARSAFLTNTQYEPVYQGQKTLPAGIITDWWLDCVYIEALKATVQTEWYFTAPPPIWKSASGTQVPVLLKVNGKVDLGGGQKRDVNNIYIFNSFSDFIPDRVKGYFEIPQGTVCPHMRNFRDGSGDQKPHDLPVVAANGQFSFVAELVQKYGEGSEVITSVREMYDNKLMMSRYDLNPGGIVQNLLIDEANIPITEIHDFQTGLVYIVDRTRFNCTIAPLGVGAGFDVKSIDNSHVRMKTVNEFMKFTSTDGSRMNWTYTGQRYIRDIKCDVFAAERLEDGDPNQRSVWEVAFMSKNVAMVNRHEQVREVNEPVRIWSRMADGKEMTYNIYDFDEEQPDLYHYTFSECYTDDQKEEVTFKLPGKYLSLVEANKKEFYYFLLIGLSGYLDVTVSRINMLSFHSADNGDAILVRFTLLDPPNIQGTTRDDLPSNYMLSRADIKALMKVAIDNGDFLIKGGTLTNNGQLVEMTAIKGSLGEKDKTTVTNTVIQLDQGAAAGIGIALFVVGLGLGVLIIFLVNRFRGQALPNLNLSFSPKVFKDES